ncbi:MAG: CBS domain-containing protein [Halobacteria archaeon]|nr:CBS domain-containing protein [Halobacteria archaeon]
MESSSKPKVEEYMTEDVVTVSPDDTVGDVIEKIMQNRGHSGFPVVDEGEVKGFISANDLLGKDDDDPIEGLMSTDLIVASPEMKVNDAARVILRSGIQKLPVVDDDGQLMGIISNSDVIRSQIERVTPSKVWKLMSTLEEIHDTEVEEERREIDIHDLVPTQEKIYADELDGRSYELKRGLAEPLIVIEKENDDEKLLVDGHHRVIAANRLDIDEMDAYVILVKEDVELGMDVEVVDYARHPLIEATHYEGDASDDRSERVGSEDV